MVAQIKSVQIRNYRSIGQVRVELEPFTALVGRNGAGKSNFIDALSFVQECLASSVDLAFKSRGGIFAVRRRSGGHPTHIGIRLTIDLADGSCADYEFEIAAKPTERFRVAFERCMLTRLLKTKQRFELKNGTFTIEIPGIRARIQPDRLALPLVSATEEFHGVYDFLTSMHFYSIVPGRLRELQEPDPGDYLKRDGSNAAAVLKRLREEGNGTERYERLCRLLSKVVEGVKQVEYRAVGQKETLQFKQDVGLKDPWAFETLNMSDGTLRVLGLLLAVYQPGAPSVVAIEEPEATVHPAACELIMDVLLNAANERQVLVTTHSPDILDHKGLTDSQIRVVSMERGNTLIAPLAESSRQAIRDHLYTPGELLRNDELHPDLAATPAGAKEPDLPGILSSDDEGR